MVRRASTEKFERIEHLRDRLTLHQGDLLDHRSLIDTLRASKPNEIYNLAAMSFVGVSWIQPTLTAEFTGVGVTRLLEAIREVCPEVRFYQASSSEMFGKVLETPQTESTPFYPRSPVRRGEGLRPPHHGQLPRVLRHVPHVGILFNHECVAELTPSIVRRNGVVQVERRRISCRCDARGASVQTHSPNEASSSRSGTVRTGRDLLAITATRRRATDPDHRLLSIEARCGIVQTTAHHTMVDDDLDPLRADAVVPGDQLGVSLEWPETGEWTALTPELSGTPRSPGSGRPRGAAAPGAVHEQRRVAPAEGRDAVVEVLSRYDTGWFGEVRLRPEPIRWPARSHRRRTSSRLAAAAALHTGWSQAGATARPQRHARSRRTPSFPAITPATV